MSVTRGQHESRPEGDFYETPEWCTRAIAKWLKAHGIDTPQTILDPGAGSGAITQVLREEWKDAYITAIDLHGSSRLVKYADEVYVKHDFLTASLDPGPQDLCVCNPPFSNAKKEDMVLAFIRHAMDWCLVGAFLTRLNWLAAAPTKKKGPRYEYLKGHQPSVLVLGKRPSFTGKGTDATEYCWLVWGIKSMAGRWEILELP